MHVQKIIGFALLAGGIGIILYSLYASFTFFTGSAAPPEIFSVDVTAPKDAEKGTQNFSLDSLSNLGSQIPKLLEGQLQGMLPVGLIPKMLNLTVWSIFAGILMLGGGQIAGLGIKLLKA
ncbi:MAG: hypothetical protein A3C82_00535 [Candidatus Wildermuthbacteria bacterium RIFCSPHIGHO2_02_FULL_47_12]|uniref:Uncharacterized protein n=1 Tax=Candidatus Wildermuthbacteria bacterium RIFCSPHIGHO2_02_FULL_47_12 TaxID=1802451 RepID=A0A1G2R1W8_9BACT|nr:MAG: hypothetical protein A3C82_00535 [Candidatus Wildermuthbacteria bacterium RIFCSPHIGHO2_02_FULL_47_12]